MPNTVVKLINAESTRPEAAREDRKLLIKRKRTFRDGCPFLFVNLQEIFLLFFYVWEVGANCSADVLSHSAAAPQLKSVRILNTRLFLFLEYDSSVADILSGRSGPSTLAPAGPGSIPMGGELHQCFLICLQTKWTYIRRESFSSYVGPHFLLEQHQQKGAAVRRDTKPCGNTGKHIARARRSSPGSSCGPLFI